MKNRPGGSIILFCLIILLLPGCFRKGNAGKQPEKIKLVYADVTWAKYDDMRRQQMREFEKLHPDVECTYLPLPINNLGQKLKAMFEGKKAPDVFVVRGIAEDLLENRLLDLTPYVERDWDYFKDFNSKALKRVYGRYYAIPINTGAVILFYNKRLFDEAGVPYPNEEWDWSDFREAAIKLTKRDKQGRVVQWGASMMALWWQLALENGARIWNEDRTQCVFDSQEAADAFRFYRELFAKYGVTPAPEPANRERFRMDFRNGIAAMFIGDRWRSVEFKEGPVRDDWRVAPMPKAYNGSRRWEYKYSILGVSVQSKHPEMAYELLKFMTRSEFTRYLIESGDSIPLRTSGEEMRIFLDEKGRPPGENENYLKAIDDPESYGRFDVFSDLIPLSRQMQVIQEGSERYMLPGSRMTAEESVKLIARKMNSLYRKYKAYEKVRDEILAKTGQKQ